MALLRRRLGRAGSLPQAASLVDALTGLGNHRALQEELERQVGVSVSSGHPFSLLSIDVDGFRATNDAYGHDAGDGVLRAVADAMRDVATPADRPFRVSADEFAMIMPGAEGERAAYTAQRILHLCGRPLDGIAPITFSGGITSVPRYGKDARQAVRQAGAALDWARRVGPGTIEMFDPDRDQTVDEGAATAVREIVAGRALAAVYQPIVDVRSGRVLGFEGLIRPDPAGPLPDTTRLFEAATATGYSIELDVACVEVVVAGAAGMGADQVLTLNLSPATLEVEDFDAAWLLDRLTRAGIPTSRVVLEMTDLDGMHDLRRLQATFDHLHRYGVRVAADDVGAANGGMPLLSHVPFDLIKIDLGRLRTSATPEVPIAALASLRDLAVSHSALIVAEGVETAEQLRTIQGSGIEVAQGYLLGRPGISTAAAHIDLVSLAAPGRR